ncbi:hypothetical protein [Enterovirga sp.]|uniref:hypothetical protein n=1 Tax=Enterovirga sp. TaxID=2026350 RepID=UPI002D1DD452|nr:hypothetical protein [Enterovirga sp.]HMO28458.1 hypothetical protein [Enterovirga sp.]
MRQIFLAAALLLAGSALMPAAAQYYQYGPPSGYGPPPGYGHPPGYGPPPRYGNPYGPPPRPRYRPSTVCVTARGPCPIGGVVPRGTPCGCVVPGFGYKRGNAG